MLQCKVVNAVISQQKESCLVGKKLLLCETNDGNVGRKIVAVDLVGAGVGSTVLVARKYAMNNSDDYIDDYIVAIVDESI